MTRQTAPMTRATLMTIAEFRATGRGVADIGAEVRDIGLEGIAGRMYHGDAFIEADGAGYCLTLGNESWVEPLASLEARLYMWCLTECADGIGVSEALSLMLASVEGVIGEDEFRALVTTPAPETTATTAIDDACDVPHHAAEAISDTQEMDEDAIDSLLGEFYELIEQCAFATDDSRSNGPRA